MKETDKEDNNMRRGDRQRDRAFALDVIDRCEYGVVAIHTQEEMPYCLPLSLVREGDTLYFHCALEGKKLQLLEQNPHVFITFVAENIACTEKFTTYFQSAMVAGTAYEITGDEEKIHALRVISQRLTPTAMPDFDRAIAKSLAVTGVWGIHIDQIDGKEKAKKPPQHG